jgi:hypothetical protein
MAGTVAEYDEQQRIAKRAELRSYLTIVGERMSSLRTVINSDPTNPATLGRLDAHIVIMRAALDALSRLDHEATR